MIGRLAAAIDRKERMRETFGINQARLVRRPANRVDRLVLEHQELVGCCSIVPFPRNHFFLHF